MQKTHKPLLVISFYLLIGVSGQRNRMKWDWKSVPQNLFFPYRDENFVRNQLFKVKKEAFCLYFPGKFTWWLGGLGGKLVRQLFRRNFSNCLEWKCRNTEAILCKQRLTCQLRPVLGVCRRHNNRLTDYLLHFGSSLVPYSHVHHRLLFSLSYAVFGHSHSNCDQFQLCSWHRRFLDNRCVPGWETGTLGKYECWFYLVCVVFLGHGFSPQEDSRFSINHF